MSKRSERVSVSKRVPVLIDRDLYEQFKQFALTANHKPVSVTSVIRYALQEFMEVATSDDDFMDGDQINLQTLATVIPIDVIHKQMHTAPKDMN